MDRKVEIPRGSHFTIAYSSRNTQASDREVYKYNAFLILERYYLLLTTVVGKNIKGMQYRYAIQICSKERAIKTMQKRYATQIRNTDMQ